MQGNNSPLAPIPPPLSPVPPKPPAPWGFWATVGFGVVIIFGFVMAQAVVAFAYSVSKVLAQPNINLADLMQSVITGDLLTIATVASAVVGLGLTVLFVKVRGNIRLSEYLGFKQTKVSTMLYALLAAAVIIALTDLATTRVTPSQFENQMVDAYRNMAVPAFLWVAFVVIGPLFEEVFFRGFLFAGFLKSPLGATGTIIVTGLFWSALHFTQYGVWELVGIFTAGLLFGYVRYRTGSIWNTLAMHSFWNLVSMVVLALQAGGVIKMG